MNKKLQIPVVILSTRDKLSKLFIVTILLTAFSSAYIIDFPCLCNLKQSKLIASEQNQHCSKKKHHNENTAEERHNNTNSKTGGCCSNDGNCCCENTTISLLSDLPKLIATPLELKVKIFNVPLYIHNIDISNYQYHREQFIAYQYKLPPPKIPDIRVFIQSFII